MPCRAVHVTMRKSGRSRAEGTRTMNIYLALTLFSLMILIYWVISELFAMLFRFTGLTDEKARFQGKIIK